MTHLPGVPVVGEYSEDWKHIPEAKCRHCGVTGQRFYRLWESSCGGWEDEKHECRNCGKSWWVEGIDS